MQTFTITLFNKKFDVKQDVDGKFILPPELKCWENRGTALKPSWEPIIVAMKPLDGTFAHNAETHQVAGLNIDGGRINTEDNLCGGAYAKNSKKDMTNRHTVTLGVTGKDFVQPQGRWPANLILDEEAGAMLDEQSGISNPTKQRKGKKGGSGFGFFDDEKT